MKKRIRGIYLKFALPAVAILLALAALLLLLTGFGVTRAFGEPAHIDDIPAGKLNGAYAYVNVIDILGDFAALPKSYDAEGNIAEYMERYCVYKTEGGDYISICIRNPQELANVAQYVNALEAYSTEELAGYDMGTIEGTIGRLDDKMYDMLIGWVRNQDAGEHDELYLSQHVLRLTLEDGYLGTTPRSTTWVLTIAALVLALVALALVIELLLGLWERPMRTLIRDIGGEAAKKDYDSGENFGKTVRIGPGHIYLFGRFVTQIVETEKVIWAYARSRRLEGGALVWSLVLKTTEGEEYAAKLGAAGLVQTAIDALSGFGGVLVTGYDKEKQRLYEKDLSGFIGRAKKQHGERAVKAVQVDKPED